MKTILRMVAFCSLVFLLVYLLSGVSICQSQQQTEQFATIDRISLHIDGSATWYVETRYLLPDANATIAFLQYFLIEKETRLLEFATNTMFLVNVAQIKTGRNMEAKNFTIDVSFEYSQTDLYGLVKYQYEWLGFAKIEGKHIMMGDALWWPRHLYLRRETRDAFIVEYPSGYRVTDVSPLPDYEKESERVLKWYGDRQFSGDKPSVVFEERTFTIIDTLIENLPIAVGGIAMISVSFVGLWFYRSKRKKEMEALASNMSSPLEMRSEEDKVIELLKAAGGSSYQSTITKHCGFSKAKTSMLLTSMEIRGIVMRKKQGREKVVTLLEKS
jgi:hypothetical protein